MALKYPNACCSAPTVTLFATDHLCSMVLNSLRGCERRVKKRTKRGEKRERKGNKKEKKNEMLYTVAETVFWPTVNNYNSHKIFQTIQGEEGWREELYKETRKRYGVERVEKR